MNITVRLGAVVGTAVAPRRLRKLRTHFANGNKSAAAANCSVTDSAGDKLSSPVWAIAHLLLRS